MQIKEGRSMGRRRGRGLGGRSASKHQKKGRQRSAEHRRERQSNVLKQQQEWVDSWPQISQSDSRQVTFASRTSQLNLIPLPIPFLGLWVVEFWVQLQELSVKSMVWSP